MANILGKARANDFNTPVTAVLNGVKKGLLFAVGFAFVYLLQVTFFSSGAIASPLANIFGDQVDKKVIDKLADTSKDFAKEAGKRTKELAKNVKEGTKENIGKAKDVAKDVKDKIGDGVDKAKEIASDRTNEVKDRAKDLPEKAGNKAD